MNKPCPKCRNALTHIYSDCADGDPECDCDEFWFCPECDISYVDACGAHVDYWPTIHPLVDTYIPVDTYTRKHK